MYPMKEVILRDVNRECGQTGSGRIRVGLGLVRQVVLDNL